MILLQLIDLYAFFLLGYYVLFYAFFLLGY